MGWLVGLWQRGDIGCVAGCEEMETKDKESSTFLFQNKDGSAKKTWLQRLGRRVEIERE